MKAKRKWSKVTLASGVRKLSPFFLMSKLDKFPLFDNFFLDLAYFWDLDNFLIFDNFWDLDNFLVFDNFPLFLIDSSPPSTPPTSLAANTLSAISTYNNTVIFSINISDAAILMKS